MEPMSGHLSLFLYRSLHLSIGLSQVDAQLQVVRKLEEKERLLQGTIGTAERELALRTQALDMNKRKVSKSHLWKMMRAHTHTMDTHTQRV